MADVSFVVTVFNKEDFLPRLFDNLIRAAREADHAEFVFVDDGSTDRSRSLLGEFAARENRAVVIAQSNAGPAMALNRGVRAARYPIVKPMDADDLLIEGAITFLLKGLALGAPLVTAGKDPSDLAGFAARRGVVDLGYTLERDALKRAIAENWCGCTDVMFERDAFLAVGGCDERLFVQDYSFIRRMCARYPIVRTSTVIGVEFAPEGRISQNRAQVQHDLNGANIDLLIDFPELPRTIKKLAFRRAAQTAWKWDRRHNGARFGRARSFWVCMLAYLPLLVPGEELSRETLIPFRVGGTIRSPSL
jgi:glycosyltransferase involved in cell wall biosynthesis